MSQKRQHFPVPLKEGAKEMQPAKEILWREAKEGMERLLGTASDELREAIEGFLIRRNPKLFDVALLREFQLQIQHHHVSRESVALFFQRA
jgi:hypothetical protein